MLLRGSSQSTKPKTRLLGGIGLRLLIGVLAFSSAVTLGLTVMQLYLEFRRDVGTINHRLDEIGRSYLETVAQSLWTLDEDQLRLQLNGILRLPDIRAAEVRETTQTSRPFRVTVGEGGTDAGIVREYPVIYAIGSGDRIIGQLRVEATLASVYRSLMDRALIILASQGAKTFLVSFFILLIFHRLVTRHLADVAGSLGGFSFKGPHQLLALRRNPPRSPDELDQVVVALNTMFAKLETAYRQLSEANVQLELDNTALVQAEAALRESERLFRDYTETASDWLWETGPDHRFTHLSEGISTIGVDPGHLIGTHRWDRAADLETDAEKWREHRAALERHEPFRALRYSLREKDGSLRYVTTSGKPIFDESGRFCGYRGTARDVTARSLAEAKVRELSIAVEQSPAGIAIVDPTGQLVYSNRVFLEIVGLAGTDPQMTMDAIIPDETWQRLRTAAQSGSEAHEEVFAERLSQGSFWGLVSVAEIKSSHGDARRLVVALQDITREKAEQLEREGLLRRLQQTGKMEAIGRLAGGIAHDFNNLLGAAMGFSQFLVEDLPERSESHRHAERIVNICERGRDLVEQLLAFAQARDTERRVVNLAVALHQCRDLLEASLPSSSKFIVEVKDSKLPVLGNEGQIHQILLNLCLNAKDALGSKPGTITIRLSQFHPDPQACSEAARLGAGQLEQDRVYALIAVSDTGVGMDAATQSRIFEPFYTTKALGRGTGLGLAVVHGIVTSYGGVIHIESTPGEGTTFEIYLPLEDAPLEAEEAGPPRQHDVRGKERILVVDDDPDLVHVLTIGLNRYGYQVVSLTDPLKALGTFMEAPERWDLVVSDQVMPGLTGLALIAKLKEIRPELRAILYTGFEEGITESIASQQGVDALLHKPISPRALADHIRRVMAERAPQA
jgi:PAS domain S-box-containing protein